MDIDITDIVRDYLIRFLGWVDGLTDTEALQFAALGNEAIVDAFLKEDQ